MGSTEFEITATPAAAGRRIAVRGDLDLATVPELRNELEAALEAGGAIVVALDECTFLDSSALKAISDASRAADEAGVELAIVRPSPQVARVLEMSGLDAVVTIEQD